MALISWALLQGTLLHGRKERLGRAAGQVELCVRQKGTRNQDWVQAQPDGLPVARPDWTVWCRGSRESSDCGGKARGFGKILNIFPEDCCLHRNQCNTGNHGFTRE